MSDLETAAHDTSSDQRTALACRGLWKAFGPRADRVVADPELAALPKDELREATGTVVAVRDVSFEVRRGEIFVVMGLSGSGKSTLVRCLPRLIEPTAGTITMAGHDVRAADAAELREVRRRVCSMVFQHFGLLPNRRVRDNVAYGLEIQGVDRRRRNARADEVIELVELSDVATAYPDQLSGGMKQRVGLARALANDPQLLLLDEPFSALDPLIRADMQDEVLRLQRELGKTMVFITHDLREALRLGDRVAVMRDGELVQVGTAAELLSTPADDYVRDFTRDVPRALVLTAGDLARPRAAHDNGGTPAAAEAVGAQVLLREVLGRFAHDDRALRVVDDQGATLGWIDRATALSAVAGEPAP